MKQDLLGKIRREEERVQALEGSRNLADRATRVSVTGNREYNPGWHTALDLTNLLTVSEAITRAALTRKESRGAHFRDDHPEKDATFGTVNLAVRKDKHGEMQVTQEPVVKMSDELCAVIEEMK